MGRSGCPPALIAAGRPVVKATCIYFPCCPLDTPTDGLPSMGSPKGRSWPLDSWGALMGDASVNDLAPCQSCAPGSWGEGSLVGLLMPCVMSPGIKCGSGVVTSVCLWLKWGRGGWYSLCPGSLPLGSKGHENHVTSTSMAGL